MFYLKPYKAIKKAFKSQDEFELKCSLRFTSRHPYDPRAQSCQLTPTPNIPIMVLVVNKAPKVW